MRALLLVLLATLTLLTRVAPLMAGLAEEKGVCTSACEQGEESKESHQPCKSKGNNSCTLLCAETCACCWTLPPASPVSLSPLNASHLTTCPGWFCGTVLFRPRRLIDHPPC